MKVRAQSSELSDAESVSASRILKLSEAAKHHSKLIVKLRESGFPGAYSNFHDTITQAMEKGLVSESKARKYHEIRLKGNDGRHVY